MPVGSADLAAAVNALWDGANLDNHFKGYWPEADKAEYVVLNDQEATPNQPFPYCVFEQMEQSVVTRMSGAGASKHHIRTVPWQFRVHAREFENYAAKTIAASIAEEILAVFGGHPTRSPNLPELENGCVLISQYQNDNPMRTGDDEYEWIIDYIFTLDVPVAV